ncbi:hypothetical protein Q5752_001285 [Cryptotrichosporon argae]
MRGGNGKDLNSETVDVAALADDFKRLLEATKEYPAVLFKVDVVLVAADRISLKVHKYHLLSARFFCDMDGFRNRNEIELPDDVLETSGVIELILDMLYDEPLPARDANNFDTTARLVQRILAYVGQDKPGLWAIFRAGAKLENVDICPEAIRAGKAWRWRVAAPVRTLSRGRSTWDVSSWATKDFDGMPCDFWQALLKAGHGKDQYHCSGRRVQAPPRGNEKCTRGRLPAGIR